MHFPEVNPPPIATLCPNFDKSTPPVNACMAWLPVGVSHWDARTSQRALQYITKSLGPTQGRLTFGGRAITWIFLNFFKIFFSNFQIL